MTLLPQTGETMQNQATQTPPQLVGDGVTDETDAVQWYVDHAVPIPAAPLGKSYLIDPTRLQLPVGMGLVQLAAGAACDFEGAD